MELIWVLIILIFITKKDPALDVHHADPEKVVQNRAVVAHRMKRRVALVPVILKSLVPEVVIQHEVVVRTQIIQTVTETGVVATFQTKENPAHGN